MAVPQKLIAFFQEHPKVALGFSGGVDSAYLLYAAKQAGADIKPYFVNSQFQPDFELHDAKRLADQLAIDLSIIELDLSGKPGILNNPAERCYHCKKLVFGEIAQQALRDGYEVFIDGTNASDDAADRPGMRATMELEVLSPLRQADITKAEVRQLSREAGLFTWNKPSYACLATRIPTGDEITPDILVKVEQAENKLYDLGLRNFRVRIFGAMAKLEVPADQMERVIELKQTIIDQLTEFDQVVLDLKARQDD